MMASDRPSWHATFMAMAHTIAQRSQCPRAQVGAIIAHPSTHAILSVGYNQPPKGLPRCQHSIDTRCLETVHAEANAIAMAAQHGTALAGSVLYCTHHPCVGCYKLAINAGIMHIYYAREYASNAQETEYFKRAGGFCSIPGISRQDG